MALKRKLHWDTRDFTDFVMERAEIPFAWGTNDCAMFSADGLLAQTAVDIAEGFRGKYANEAEAFALVKAITGGETIADAAAYCAAKHGMVEREFPLMAQRGDMVLAFNGAGVVSGLVSLTGKHVLTPGERGLMKMPITSVKRAWTIE